jgi:hypothetical protein
MTLDHIYSRTVIESLCWLVLALRNNTTLSAVVVEARSGMEQVVVGDDGTVRRAVQRASHEATRGVNLFIVY